MIAENKNEFFEQLGAELERMGVVDTEEVMSDLRTHFDEGAREGRSEAEICAELGNIREIARSCLDLKSSMINSIVAENEERRKVSLTKPDHADPEDDDPTHGDYVRAYTPEHIAEETVPGSVPQDNAGAAFGAVGGASGAASDVSFSFGSKTVDEVITSNKIVDFEACPNIAVNSREVKTFVQPSLDNMIHVGVKVEDNEVSLKAEQQNGTLSIDLKHGIKFAAHGGSKSLVIIELPQTVYESISLKSGSDKLSAAGLKANSMTMEIGSGTMEIDCPQDFTGKNVEILVASGKFYAANLSSDTYKIDVKSGKCDVTGLTGCGGISVASGSVSALFADKSSGTRTFDLASGRITAFVPDDTSAALQYSVTSGSVKVDCCGMSASLAKQGEFQINNAAGNAAGTIVCNVKSGSVSFRNASAYDEKGGSELGEAARNFADAVGSTMQSAFDKAKEGIGKGLQQAADNINAKRQGNDGDIPFRPSDDYRKNVNSEGRSSEVPPHFMKYKMDKAPKFVDTTGLKPNPKFVDTTGLKPNPKFGRLLTEILLDVLLWVWLLPMLLALAIIIYAGAVCAVAAGVCSFFGMQGFGVFKLVTRIFFGLGLLSISSAIFCLGCLAMKGVASMFAMIVRRHIKAIYDI